MTPGDELHDVKESLFMLRQRVRRLETELRELRELVTPLDPGSLPKESDG